MITISEKVHCDRFAPRYLGLRWLFAVLIFTFAASFSDTAFAFKCDKVPDQAVQDFSHPRNIGIQKIRLVRYACSDAYDVAVRRVLTRAKSYLTWRAAKGGKLAIILDIDETSLLNWPAIIANDFGYIADGTCDALPKGPCGWNAWEKRAEAKAIGPTLELFNLAKAKGVAVFFVTGRRDTPERRAATETNLKNERYEGWTKLIMRPTDSEGTAQEYKTKERQKIEADGYKIIINVGDQLSDLNGGHAQRKFRVPNPFYFVK
jgi:acid phosphatase